MRRQRVGVFLVTWLTGVVLLSVPPSDAGPFDKVKKKATSEAEKKAAEAINEAPSESPEPATGGETASAQSADDTGPMSAVSTKFDFVPGDSVMLYDDFQQDELGEFPIKWQLRNGNFEVVEMNSERWLRCTSVDGRVRMKLPGMTTLPEFWTLEFDFYATEPMYSALTVSGLGAGDQEIWSGTYPQGNDLFFRAGEVTSTTSLEPPNTIPGRHHVMLMARGAGLKTYIDRQRMASVPEVFPGGSPVVALEIRLWASTGPMITNVRFAEGCRPPKDMLAEGKLVTYGIHFASGSDQVLSDSAPVLRQIEAYLKANPDVRLRITGHTDNVGSATSNLDLSKRRAASVAAVMTSEFGIAADRFVTDGQGDTVSMASNANAEGRAMNRRVEFEKL